MLGGLCWEFPVCHTRPALLPSTRSFSPAARATGGRSHLLQPLGQRTRKRVTYADRNVFSCGSGGWWSRLKCQRGPHCPWRCSGWALLLPVPRGSQQSLARRYITPTSAFAVTRCPPVCVCVPVALFLGHGSHWTRDPPDSSIKSSELMTSAATLSPNKVVSEEWELGLQHIFWGVARAQFSQ